MNVQLFTGNHSTSHNIAFITVRGVLYDPGSEIISQSRDLVSKKGVNKSLWTRYFGTRISRQRFNNREKAEPKIITINIRFANGLRSVWGSYSNVRHLSNSSCVCNEAFLSRFYTCDPPPYSSDHLPTHALMRKVMMETERVQRRKKREDKLRGLHKSPTTTTTQQYDMKAQG